MGSWFSTPLKNNAKHLYRTEKGSFTLVRNWQGVWSIAYQTEGEARWNHIGTAISLDEAKRIVTDADATGLY
jgi:hypothetical protein